MKFECRGCRHRINPDWEFCGYCDRRLPLKANQKRLTTITLLAEAHKKERQNILKSKGIIKAVQLKAAAKSCNVCASHDEEIYSLKALPHLPHVGCDCTHGCGCCLIPIPKTYKERIIERFGKNPSEIDKAIVRVELLTMNHWITVMRSSLEGIEQNCRPT